MTDHISSWTRGTHRAGLTVPVPRLPYSRLFNCRPAVSRRQDQLRHVAPLVETWGSPATAASSADAAPLTAHMTMAAAAAAAAAASSTSNALHTHAAGALGSSSASAAVASVSHHHHQHPSRHPAKEHKPIGFLPSLVSGAAQAVLFNPLDRALYLRVHNNERHLFVRRNFEKPFQGFANAALYRTISGGTYLYFQDLGRYVLHRLLVLEEAAATGRAAAATEAMHHSGTKAQLEEAAAASQQLGEAQRKAGGMLTRADGQPTAMASYLFVGVFAGTLNGLMLNQLQAVKFRLWSEQSSNFFRVALDMYRGGGLLIFFRGVKISVARDVTFGIVYETLRCADTTKQYGTTVAFGVNVAAACAASIVSSPMNYARNMVYGSPVRGCPLRVHQLLQFLAKEVMNQPEGQRFRYLNSRLNIGFGSLRVGLGMALGQLVFGRMQAVMEKQLA